MLRQWLLLEPLLLQLPAPIPASAQLQAELSALQSSLESQGSQPTATNWLREAQLIHTTPPLLLAIGQQIEQLQQLLHSRKLVRQAIEQQEAQRH
jgi:hypothetical protein